MADDKAEAFARCLLGDIYECFSRVAELNIKIPPELEDDRCVPMFFFTQMVNFSSPFVTALTPYIESLPVLLYASDDFFKRFANSVCLKLIKNGDDDLIPFLKVTAFLIIITMTAFVDGCYRTLDEIPGIYHRMLRDHLRTKFYKEYKFDDVICKCTELNVDEEWKSNTLDEMRRIIEESFNDELAATKVRPNSFEHNSSHLRIIDLKQQNLEKSESDIVRCKYCGINCILLLKVFFQPRIMYKPECQQM